MKGKAHYIFLFIALFFTTALFAQVDRSIGQSQYKRAPKGKSGVKKDFIDQIMDYYGKELNLDDFQQAAVRQVIEDQRDEMMALNQQNDITSDEKRDKAKVINDKIDAGIIPMLSPDQVKKYQELISKRKF